MDDGAGGGFEVAFLSSSSSSSRNVRLLAFQPFIDDNNFPSCF